jgi:hypothetical protein
MQPMPPWEQSETYSYSSRSPAARVGKAHTEHRFIHSPVASHSMDKTFDKDV